MAKKRERKCDECERLISVLLGIEAEAAHGLPEHVVTQADALEIYKMQLGSIAKMVNANIGNSDNERG